MGAASVVQLLSIGFKSDEIHFGCRDTTLWEFQLVRPRCKAQLAEAQTCGRWIREQLAVAADNAAAANRKTAASSACFSTHDLASLLMVTRLEHKYTLLH